MTKTKSKKQSKRNKTIRLHKEKYEATFEWLNKWYVMEFEKLGWMVLAKYRGYTDKVSSYLTSLQLLKEALEHKLTHLKEHDRKEDVHIMLDSLHILIDHANKDLR